MRRKTMSRMVLALTVACGWGCEGVGRDTDPADAAILEDVVVGPGPAWSPDRGWTVSPEPLWSLGDGSGGPDDTIEFGLVTHAVTLAGDRLVIGDAQAKRLYYVDETGRVSVRAADPGRGPGELSGIQHMFTCADTVWVRAGGQLDAFGPDGEFIRRVVTPPLTSASSVYGVSSDCRRFLFSTRADMPKVGRQGPRRSVLSWSAEPFSDWDSITTRTVAEVRTVEMEGSAVPFAIPWTGTRQNLGIVSDGVVVGWGSTPELHVFSNSGSPMGVYRWAPERRLVDSDDRRTYADRRKSVIQEVVKEHGAAHGFDLAFPPLADLESAPEVKPYFDGLLVDPEDNVWLRAFPDRGVGEADEYEPRPRLGPESWTVLDSAGTWLGHVAIPEGVALLSVGRDAVFGVRRGPLGVQTVVALPLQR